MLASLVLVTVLCCTPSLAGYEYPWVKAQGARATQRLPPQYIITAALAGLAKTKEVKEGPRLVSRQFSRLVVSSGSSVTLNCTIEDAGDVSVTWTRDKVVLTVDRLRYTKDQRVSSLHQSGSRDHGLRLARVQPQDTGVFRCHVGTDPEQVAEVKLIVIDAYSVIFGSSEVSVAEGGTLYLLCMVLQVTDVPEYILWYHNTNVIDYSRKSISVKTDEETRSSELQVRNINHTDAGNYTCDPSNATPAFVSIAVFKDTNKKSGPPQKCDDCVLFIQLGATFAFFTLSFVVALCIHSRDHRSQPWIHSLSEDLYFSTGVDKSL